MTRIAQLDAAMERLRAEHTLLAERIRASEVLHERASLSMLLAETPAADHAYRLARDDLLGLRARMADLQTRLGALILEREESRAPASRAG